MTANGKSLRVSSLPLSGNEKQRRSKRKRFFIRLAALFFWRSSACPAPCLRLRRKGDGKEELNQNILDQIDKLDTEELQKYIDSLGVFSDKNVGERIFDYIKGEKFDYGSFGQQILNVLFEDVKNMLPAFACICAVALLCGILSSVKSSFADQTSADVIFLVGYAAALIPVLAVLTECFSRAWASVASMQKQMQLVFPILMTLMAASGGSVSAAIYQPAVAFLSTSIVSIVSSVVLPLTLTIIAFSMAGNLSGELKLNNFSSFFKSINKWIIGACVSVFGLFFTVQGLTAATYDGITRRAAKYAIGTGVPIVGGFLSGGFDLAVAGSVLIKNSLGSLSIFLMVSVLFEPLVLLMAANLFLRLTAAVTQPLGESRISNFLGETADNLNYCTAGLLFVAFLYFIGIVLVICSSEVIF
ncbi:MAG: stage III sporulation protein AE [Christensenellaceae bacterium]